MSTVTLHLRIENTYEDGEEVITNVGPIEVPAPPADPDERDEWAEDHLFEHTGTGRVEGNACYDIVITESSDPALVGATFDFGY